MNKCIIVIPVYKPVPSNSEYASFRQCLTILSNYDICIMTYEELDLSYYKNIAEKTSKSYYIEYFDKHYFDSVAGYNRLCYDKNMYLRFIKYEYMLIYQLDVWVFRDELKYWCDKGYDYIGPPLFRKTYWKGQDVYSRQFWGVGNGGFSLRKIRYCIDKLSIKMSWLPYFTPSMLCKIHYPMKMAGINSGCLYLIRATIIIILKSIGIRNSLGYFQNSGMNEDVYFSLGAVNSWRMKPKIPKTEEAALFGFERFPSYLYSITGKLPFGCHAFEKYEYKEFWKEHIKLE